MWLPALFLCLVAAFVAIIVINRDNIRPWFRRHKRGVAGVLVASSVVASVFMLIPMGDEPEPPDPAAYDMWYAPENSFGVSETKTVNETYFKQLFNDHFYKKALYKRYGYSEWTDGTQYLTLNKTWNSSGFWKVDIILDVPVDLYSVNISFGCDLVALDYIERDGYEVTLVYPANETENYTVMFNWSDIAQIPDLEIFKVREDGKFWISFKRDYVSAGYYVFDPTFGYSGATSTVSSIVDYVAGSKYTLSADGTGNSITAKMGHAASIGVSDVKCALYDSSLNLVVNGVTEEKQVTNLAVAGVDTTFVFEGTKPVLTAGDYTIVAWCDTVSGNGLSMWRAVDEGVDRWWESHAYNGFPASLSASDRTGAFYIYCDYTEDGANTAPTITGEIPVNESTGISVTPQLNVTVDDAEDDWLNVTWLSNSSGSWVWFARNSSIDGATLSLSIVQTNSNFSESNTTYYYSVNVSDGTTWTNTTYSFTTSVDTVTITLIDHRPLNIRTNSSEPSWFIYNITTNSTEINYWSIVWAYGVNHTDTNDHRTHYSLEDHLAVDKLRGYNRNENITQENKWDNVTGDSSLGGYGEWNTHDFNYGITFIASGSNWTRVNATEEETEHLFSHIAFVDEEEIREEQKTGQELDVTGSGFVKVEFNMSDTSFWDTGHYNNTLYMLHFYANQTNANKPISVYYVNSSYTTGDIASSPYAAFIGQIQPNTGYHISEFNSSYYELRFSSSEAGFVGTVDMTEKFYIIFTGQGAAPKKWWIHYADSNLTHVVEGVTHYHDFDNRTIVELSSNGGGSWVVNASTPDIYLDFVSLNEEDVSEVKLYANDTSDNEAWSSVHTDLIDITNYPPNCPDILTPNATLDYATDSTINITYTWIGDPNRDTCWVNITYWNWDTTTLGGYIENRSITSTTYLAGTSFYYVWDTTDISFDNYTIAINVTDPYNSWCNTTSEIFNISYYDTTIRTDGVDYFVWLGGNTTAYHIAANITGMDEAGEYVALLNATGGFWKFSYGDTNDGVNDWIVTTHDVIKVYLDDAATTETFNMSYNPDWTYDEPRTVTLDEQGNGYNYTAYTTTSSTTLSTINSTIGLASGYFVALWNETNYAWDFWIAYWPYSTDKDVHQYDVCLTKISTDRTWSM